MVDTTIEKKLKNDILRKHSLKNEIEKCVGAVSQWKDKLAKLKNFQGQTKYTDSIKRYIYKIEDLRVKLNQMNEEMDKHIREVGKFSDSEVKTFSSQLEQEISDIEAGNESNSKKDIEEIKNARKNLAELKGKGNLQQKIEKTREKISEDLEEIERATGKIIKLNRHLKKVDGGAGSASEDQDELLYTQELKRIVREKAIYG